MKGSWELSAWWKWWGGEGPRETLLKMGNNWLEEETSILFPGRHLSLLEEILPILHESLTYLLVSQVKHGLHFVLAYLFKNVYIAHSLRSQG